MNRRAFFCRAASLLPLPAFVKAASLWLPKERPWFKPEPEWTCMGPILLEAPSAWDVPGGMAYMYENLVWLHPEEKKLIEAHILEHQRLILGAFSGANKIAKGESCRP